MNIFFSLKNNTLRLILFLCVLTIVVGPDTLASRTQKVRKHSSTATIVTDSTKLSTEKKTKVKEKTVYVTNTGSKYHAAGCRYLRKSSIPISLSEAKKSYSPCSVCNP